MKNIRNVPVVVLNALLSLNFFFVNPDMFDPDGGLSANGDLVSLVDSNGRTIVAPKYSRIDYAGHGLFIMSSINKPDPYVRGNERYLFTSSGEEIRVKVPAGGQFRRILWLGSNQLDNDVKIQKLPIESLFTFVKNGKYGVSDIDGNQIVDPQYNFIDIPHDGVSIMLSYADRHTKLSLFDVQKRRVVALPLKDIDGIFPDEIRNSTYFSEGVAACKVRDENGFSKYGYIDTSGNFVIAPQFVFAGPFMKGVATVSMNGNGSYTIDKTGKQISPDLLDVAQFRGEYAIAKNRAISGGYGIVNRKFEFVINPDFRAISAVERRKAYSHFFDVKSRTTDPPDFYLCDSSVYSRDCRFLFNFPPNFRPSDDVTASYWGGWKSDKPTYFDFSGKETTKPPTIERRNAHETVYLVAPDRYVLLVSTDSGKFDPRYWSLQHDSPISRLTMFSRFLQENDLIGMEIENVLRLLGPGMQRSLGEHQPTHVYSLISGGCVADSAVLIKLNVSNSKIQSWNFNTMFKDLPPITENVLIKSANVSSSRVPETVPKYAASQAAGFIKRR